MTFSINEIKIEGKAIYLKGLTETDASEEYCSWLNDPQVTEHLVTIKTTVEELKKYIKEKNENRNCLFLGIFYKENNKHIGNIKIEPIDFVKKTGIMGILIGDKKYWGKGIGPEAIKLLTSWTFANLDLETIEAGAFPENKRSVHVFKKAGFVIDRIEKQSVMHMGKLSDNIIMIIKKP